MTLDYRNGVSIAEIVVYVPALAIAIFLAIRHGFRRNAGWMFLIIFCLARIIGPCMQLATISNPTSISLYTGSAILQNIGLSPLELAAIGLLGRLLESINRSHKTIISSRGFKLIELIITIGLILGIVGGVNAASTVGQTFKYQPGSLNKAGTALFIVSWVAIVLATIFISFHVSHAEPGEKRILIAVAISLPFILIRLIYSCFSTFSTNKNFNLITGNVTVLLCVALIEEFIVVVLYEATGLTLHKVQSIPVGTQQISSPEDAEYAPQHPPQQQAQFVSQQNKAGGSGNKALNIAKRTIIGRIVMSFVPENSNRDVEMQRHQYVQK
jgi:hypothetical protein